MRDETNEFFSGLKVVELAAVLAGPAVGMFFAELGADVLKIENARTSGDMTRTWRLASESTEKPISAYWAAMNWGKKVVQKDLENEGDRAWVLEKISEADVVISNFKTASARRLEMDFGTLKKTNPRLIYAQIDSFSDENDPRPAFDIVLQAETGFLSMTGESNRPPVKMPVALIDLLAAHQLKAGILVALLKREKVGKGSLVRVSLFESALASLANQATNFLMEKAVARPMGSAHPNIAPYGDQFLCKDGWSLVLAVGTEKQFVALCAVLGLDTLVFESKFAKNAARVANRIELAEILASKIALFERAVLVEKLNKKCVPVGRILGIDEALEQPEAQKMILESEAEGYPTRCLRTVVFKISN